MIFKYLCEEDGEYNLRTWEISKGKILSLLKEYDQDYFSPNSRVYIDLKIYKMLNRHYNTYIKHREKT